MSHFLFQHGFLPTGVRARGSAWRARRAQAGGSAESLPLGLPALPGSPARAARDRSRD